MDKKKESNCPGCDNLDLGETTTRDDKTMTGKMVCDG